MFNCFFTIKIIGGNCFNCGKSGHISRECEESRRDGGYSRGGRGGDRDRNGGGGGLKCFQCGGSGHFARYSYTLLIINMQDF